MDDGALRTSYVVVSLSFACSWSGEQGILAAVTGIVHRVASVDDERPPAWQCASAPIWTSCEGTKQPNST